MVTGTLGGSSTGKHLNFQPRVIEARQLDERVSLHAMIDISDGLSADLHHILNQSQVGAVVDAAAIPTSPAAGCLDDGRSPLEHALCDGEDFELLFCVSPQDGSLLLDNPPCALRLTKIGEVVSPRTCHLRSADGTLEPLHAQGWKHAFGEHGSDEGD
jgi:thiamine-monophosphate kinase